ncbi:hypothetical protein [Gilvimarinus algae]|uniref:Uncharacterized protein n=1 Tax=Gilvimarinus algae TaxID=3058037 RepID=A0ABT8TBA1_9GAMM|nr:hypothetical protein [Gilvimarinus sp. SDUM040014]MDO3381389.1 hypothetical protein [Gilvimarinus sp. SDUM040014]
MINSRLLTKIVCFLTISLACSPASASLKQMGLDYRSLLSNHVMLSDIKKRCADIQMPEVASKPSVEIMMQQKVGIEAFANLMINIQRSDLEASALATIEKLFTQIDGCEDPRLQAALGRIAAVHSEAYQRLKAEPALVKPQNVPVPMRRN